MDLSQYRRDLGNYFAAAERNRLEKYFGLAETIPCAEIEERAADLFSLTTVCDLEKSLTNADEITETERQARKNLLNNARLHFLKNQTREIGVEFEACRESARVSFQNENLTFSETFVKIALEEDSALRRELYERMSEARASCADLWLENFKIRREWATKIGFENYQSLFEEIAETDFESFGQKAGRFLAETEESYFRMLSEVFPETKRPHPADFYFRLSQLERREIFAGKNLSDFYRRLLENFGFRSEKISQVRFSEVSAEKQTDFFRPHFPASEIVFAVSTKSGNTAFSEFLKIFGKTQQAAWTSADLASRFPEFVFSPDALLGDGYGILFQTLLTDEIFLRRNFGLWNEKQTRKIARENEFWFLAEIRQNVLRMLFEIKVHSTNAAAETTREFADVFSQNLGFTASETDVLFRLSEDFAPAGSLRAALFAFGLREYLRSRYDFDWWNSRAAFEELIDFWNTAERYRAEEMARMIGFEMDFETMKEI